MSDETLLTSITSLNWCIGFLTALTAEIDRKDGCHRPQWDVVTKLKAVESAMRYEWEDRHTPDQKGDSDGD